jgi:GT2 family glycosyltransferase
MNPKVLVLILSYNGKHLLEESISSYLNNDYHNFEVVVIDNGSNDGTKQWVEEHYPMVTLLRTEVNLKYSGGFNLGLKYAFEEKQSDYVLITNNDVKADPATISSLIMTVMKDKNIGFVTGKVFYYDEPELIQSVGYIENPRSGEVYHRGQGKTDTGEFDLDEELNCSDDIFMLVRKEVYEAVGGYDINLLFQCEQWDWQERAKEAGFIVYFSANAKIWHKESMTIGKFSPFKLYYDMRNTMIVIFKHKSPKQFSHYFWKSLRLSFFKGTIRYLIKGDYKHAVACVRGFLSGLKWILGSGKVKVQHFI